MSDIFDHEYEAWDGHGYEAPDGAKFYRNSTYRYKCKYCGEGKLAWVHKAGEGWRLFGKGGQHICGTGPIAAVRDASKAKQPEDRLGMIMAELYKAM